MKRRVSPSPPEYCAQIGYTPNATQDDQDYYL